MTFDELVKEHKGDTSRALAAFAAGIRAEEQAKAVKSLKVAISQKSGAVMVLGLNSFPLSLYADQWKRLSDYIPTVVAYVNANADEIAKVEATAKAAKAAAPAA